MCIYLSVGGENMGFPCYLTIPSLGFHCRKIDILIDPKLQYCQKGQTYKACVRCLANGRSSTNVVQHHRSSSWDTWSHYRGGSYVYHPFLSRVIWKPRGRGLEGNVKPQDCLFGISAKKIKEVDVRAPWGPATPWLRRQQFWGQTAHSSIDPATARCSLLFKTVLLEKQIHRHRKPSCGYRRGKGGGRDESGV